MEKQVILTNDGLIKLENELEYLKTEKRKEIAEKIKEAMAFGDLSENFEYDAAKNEQAQVETRITQIEKMLKNVRIIDENDINTHTVSLGATVRVLDIEFNEEIEYTILGSTEANPALFRISDESPVGKALLGKKVGDDVKVDTPSGEIVFRILAIHK